MQVPPELASTEKPAGDGVGGGGGGKKGAGAGGKKKQPKPKGDVAGGKDGNHEEGGNGNICLVMSRFCFN